MPKCIFILLSTTPMILLKHLKCGPSHSICTCRESGCVDHPEMQKIDTYLMTAWGCVLQIRTVIFPCKLVLANHGMIWHSPHTYSKWVRDRSAVYCVAKASCGGLSRCHLHFSLITYLVIVCYSSL